MTRESALSPLFLSEVAALPQMMYGSVVMMLPSANDVGLRPMMLRRCRKLRKLFAKRQKAINKTESG
jgi:hypothetical protein